MASIIAPKTSTARQRVRSGCYICKIRKVKCKSEVQEGVDGLDGLSSCDCCRRLGLECRWSAPSAGEDYNPPPKRRQTIGRRRERTQTSRPNETTDCTYPYESSQARGLQNDYAPEHVDGPRPSEQYSSTLAQPTSFEFNPCVDMLGDLPFDIDFDLDLSPVDLNFNGEGLDFAQLPALDHSLSLFVGHSTNPTTLTDPLSFSNSLQLQDNSHLHEDERCPNADVPWETSNLGADEQHLIQHYLKTMTGYAKVDDYPRHTNNLYNTAFSQSLSFKPLLYAILAFSASHLALENVSYFEKASEYEQLAHDSFKACKDQHSDPGSLLSALFVRAKRVHLLADDIESFHCLINEASQIALSKRGQKALEDPFSLPQRIVIRLALLDARASCYRLGGGKLIKSLRQIPAMSFLFDHDSTAGSSSNALVSLLRANILRMKVGELDLRLRFQMESEDIIRSPIRTEEVRSLHRHIEHEIRQWEHQMRSRGHDPDDVTPIESVLEASTYAQYLVMSALHGAVLYLYLLYPLKSIQWENSVSRVLHCQLKLQQDPSRGDSPSSLVPSSLFLAGISTVDPIHRDWVLERLKNGERWGTYVGRTRELIVAITMTRSTDDELDIRDLMDNLKGRFLI